ncbi:MAG: DUF4886 domain-containing protein [Muribaculaceae bacterium]
MKKIVLMLIVLVMCTFSGNAAGGITNYPIPQSPDTLRILGVGNSFTDDGMMYLPNLLAAAGIHNVVLGRLYIGGCTLERHCREYDADSHNYIYYKSVKNQWSTVLKTASLLDGVLDEPWDIIVVQQASGLSGLYSSYQPWLDKLMEILRFNCRNAGATIAWQQTWAYATTSTHADFARYSNNQLAMYQNIMSCNEKLIESTPIDVLIPTGTTIQNLRAAMHDAKEFTRDGYHLNYKMGRYAAACAWFQSLVAPAFRTTIEGNSCRLHGSSQRLSDEEAEACQLAARRACARHYAVWAE